MVAYYNEHDAFAAQWLRNLIAAGHIAPGDVDERDIRDVRPDELRAYTQCHFFAGVGVWSHALRRAGWADTRPVWTGSCPCQPFSAAGKGGGFDDERHLWPAFFHLIEQCAPRVVFGEQVASKDGLAWLDLVQADLEGTGYAVGALDLCAAGFGAPHIRQRLYWLADAEHAERRPQREIDSEAHGRDGSRWGGDAGLVADADHEGPQGRGGMPERPDQLVAWANSVVGGLAISNDTERWADAAGGHHSDGAHSGRSQGAGDVEGRCGDGGLANTDGGNASAERQQCSGQQRLVAEDSRSGGLGVADGAGSFSRQQAAPPDGHGEPVVATGDRLTTCPTNGLWRDADWLLCRDAKWRPVRPGTFPLAHGAPSRVGRLRAYGNAIVAAQAEEFINAFLSLDVGVNA